MDLLPCRHCGQLAELVEADQFIACFGNERRRNTPPCPVQPVVQWHSEWLTLKSKDDAVDHWNRTHGQAPDDTEDFDPSILP